MVSASCEPCSRSPDRHNTNTNTSTSTNTNTNSNNNNNNLRWSSGASGESLSSKWGSHAVTV
eukprot:10210662-Alexandrium_andersonii.AAC.1